METGGGFGGKEEYPSMIAGARGAAGLEIGPAGEDHLRPRRRHDRHHQAPSFGRASASAARTTASCSRSTLSLSSTAALTPRSRRWSSRAAPFTPLVRMPVPTCGFAARPSRPTLRRTALSAASEHRRASSRWNGISNKVARAVGLAPEELRRRNFLHAGKPPRPARRFART